jgi:UDP-glucose:(heptosyl)LPS alpha-1,3-glucosyltransferase
MKIAVAIPKYGLVGGAEGFAFELCERLATSGEFEIHVLANKWQSGSAPIVYHKIPIVRFPRFLQPISFAYFVQKKAITIKPDLLHSHERIFEMNLFTMHGIPHKTWVKEVRQKRPSLFDKATAWVEEKGLRGGPMVLPVSTMVKEELLRLYHLPEPNIQVVHPGVAPERFSVSDRQRCRQEIRNRHGLSLEDTVVLFVGMNFEIKRLGLVLGGIGDLISQKDGRLPVKLLIVGKGKKEPYFKIAHELGIAEHVVFAGIANRVEDYYLASDIFAMPSVFDTFGIAVLEAMMAELPVIISNTVGAKDLIVNGHNGLVLPDNPTSQDMAKALAVVMKKDTRSKMGKKARETARSRTWSKTAHEVGDIYRQILQA